MWTARSAHLTSLFASSKRSMRCAVCDELSPCGLNRGYICPLERVELWCSSGDDSRGNVELDDREKLAWPARGLVSCIVLLAGSALTAELSSAAGSLAPDMRLRFRDLISRSCAATISRNHLMLQSALSPRSDLTGATLTLQIEPHLHRAATQTRSSQAARCPCVGRSQSP